MFLRRRPQPRPPKGAVGASLCTVCSRHLQDVSAFCSLQCKLDADAGTGPVCLRALAGGPPLHHAARADARTHPPFTQRPLDTHTLTCCRPPPPIYPIMKLTAMRMSIGVPPATGKTQWKLALDNNPATCALSTKIDKPWFTIDLLGRYQVETVKLVNRCARRWLNRRGRASRRPGGACTVCGARTRVLLGCSVASRC